MQLTLEKSMDAKQQTIYVVDDDPGVSRAIESVGQLLDLPVSSFSSADEFLVGYDPSQPGCLVLDIKMPGMTGLELQQKLADDGVLLPPDLPRAPVTVLADYLAAGQELLAGLPDPEGSDIDGLLSVDFESLRWFELPRESLLTSDS